ncbi:hypothetical protein vseg_001237 [Gypsophila vaccaria]
MNGENISTNSSMVDNVIKVRILVVDDDKICLAVIASVLKLFNYEVVTINCPLEALSNLRMNPDSFDIVLSDVHMPLMNGLNFQRIVELEFRIPVILMSADDKKNLLMKSLENGAAFFIVKPPSISDLKNIWQYVVSRRKNTSATNNNSIAIKDDVDDQPCNNAMTTTNNSNFKKNNNNNSNSNSNNNNNNNHHRNDDVYGKTTSYSNNIEPSSSEHQRESSNNVEENNEGKSSSSNSKKPKLIWTTTLHNKFLEAISVIGTSRAVPKKILEYMNVPGLTRENIASHLQKYRIYVRRLNEPNGSMQHGMPMNWNERPFRSSFSWSQFPTLANNSYLLKYSNTINHAQQQANNNYGPQGLNLLNPQQNSPFNTNFVPSMNNNNNNNNLVGAHNFVHDHRLNNYLTKPMNIFESSTTLDNVAQNNKNYDEGDHFMPHPIDIINPNNNKFTERSTNNNETRGPLALTIHGQDLETQSFLPNSNSNNNNFEMTRHGVIGPRQPYFNGGLTSNMVNDSNGQMLGFMKHNNVVDNQLSNNTTTINVHVDNNMNDDASIGVGQQEITSNASNATLQSQALEDTKDMVTFNTTTTSAPSSAPHQDWTPNHHLDDFNLEYGMEDINAIFSNIDGQNGNNNQFK